MRGTHDAARTAPALTGLIALVGALGLLVVGQSLWLLPSTPNALGWIGIGALAIAAGSFALKVPGVPVYLSISDTFFITSALLFGPAPATITIAIDSFQMSWRRGNRADQMVFNATSSALSLWVAAQVFFLLAGSGPLADVADPPGAASILALGALAGVYFAINSGLIATAVALQKRVPVIRLWRQHFAVVSLSHFAAASTSFFLIVLVQAVSALAIAAVLPLLVIFYLAMRSWLGRLDDAQHHVAKVNRLYLSTVSALSTAIEAKDGVTSDHIHRVQTYAMGLARALEITDPSTLQAIEAAALLHDTGKLAIPEHILNKPGKLTAAEFETMKTHVEVGADILSSIDFPYPVVPIVRAHHESWDGSGYPNGLAGEDIPIGARILSVVDCFDALTSDRPYRPALSESAALAIIRERRGTMYDPTVVDAFERTYRDLVQRVEAPPELQQALGRIRRAHAPAPIDPAGTERPKEALGEGQSEELLAFVSLARVASRSAATSDIGALAWTQLKHVAPGATMALFELDAGGRSVVARSGYGSHSAAVAGLRMEVGHRLTGWVAANARSAVNSDARLDLAERTVEALRYAVAVPLVAGGSLVGVLSIYAPEPLEEDTVRMLEMVAPQLATVLELARAPGRGAEASPPPAPPAAARSARGDLRVVGRR